MEDFKRKLGAEINDKEIVYSRAIKAGKRIYYLDVKKNRKEEMFLAITESKKIITGEGDDSQVSFEKHKIFLYKEDFSKFRMGLEQALDFILKNDETPLRTEKESNEPDQEAIRAEEKTKEEPSTNGIGSEIKIDIEF